MGSIKRALLIFGWVAGTLSASSIFSFPAAASGSGSLPTGPTPQYISTSGSDTTGDGSQSAPWATLAKALSQIPQTVNQDYVVNVAAGTYAEGACFTRFTSLGSYSITITGDVTTPANVTFTGTCAAILPVTYSVVSTSTTYGALAVGPINVVLQGIKINVTAGYGILAFRGAVITIDRDTVTGNTTFGVLASQGGTAYLTGNVTVQGFVYVGVAAWFNSSGIISGSGTVTIAGSGAGSSGMLASSSSHITVFANNVALVISNVQFGVGASLASIWQDFGTSGGTISITNSSTPSNSAVFNGTDNSSISTNSPVTATNFTNSCLINSITYCEMSSTRTFTNIGGANTSQNSVAFLP